MHRPSHRADSKPNSASQTFQSSPLSVLGLLLILFLSPFALKVKIRQLASVHSMFFCFTFAGLSNDLCVCSCAAGVRELQLLWEVYLVQLLGDASPGPRLQPVRCQRLTHKVESHQLPRLQETAATLCPVPHEHGHTCF